MPYQPYDLTAGFDVRNWFVRYHAISKTSLGLTRMMYVRFRAFLGEPQQTVFANPLA